MNLPTIGQLKTIASYLFVIGVGVYFGYDGAGVVGAVIGGLAAVPLAIVIGLCGLWLLAELLGYSSRKTNKGDTNE